MLVSFNNLNTTYNTLEWESMFSLRLSAAKSNNYIKNDLNKSCAELNFLQKTRWKHISLYTRSRVGREGLQRFAILKYNALEWKSKFTLRLNAAKKYRLYQKMLQIKIV